MPTRLLVALVALLSATFAFTAQGQEYSSADFRLRDSTLSLEGGRSTSSSFTYFSTTAVTALGEGVAQSFIERSGFLFFPTATSPVVSSTNVDSAVSLSWTTSAGTLAAVDNYQVGVATSSGGAFTYEDVGRVTSFIKSGLTNGTTYYFKIKARAGGETVAESSEVSGTPAAAVAISTGGASTVSLIVDDTVVEEVLPVETGAANVAFSGRAYPNSNVTLLKDAQIAVTTVAGPDAKFSISLSGLSAGTYEFTVYSTDTEGRRSSLLTFPVMLTAGAATQISGLFIAPTIAVDQRQVKLGDNIAIFGQTTPESEVTIAVNSHEQFFSHTNSDVSGAYLYNFDTTPLEGGTHLTKAKAATAGEISPYGSAVSFIVDGADVSALPPTHRGDITSDGRVNLVDFSVLAYWYGRTLSEEFAALERKYFNGDRKIDLIDFSILAFFWTG